MSGKKQTTASTAPAAGIWTATDSKTIKSILSMQDEIMKFQTLQDFMGTLFVRSNKHTNDPSHEEFIEIFTTSGAAGDDDSTFIMMKLQKLKRAYTKKKSFLESLKRDEQKRLQLRMFVNELFFKPSPVDSLTNPLIASIDEAIDELSSMVATIDEFSSKKITEAKNKLQAITAPASVSE
jgi:hypothetical protein